MGMVRSVSILSPSLYYTVLLGCCARTRLRDSSLSSGCSRIFHLSLTHWDGKFWLRSIPSEGRWEIPDRLQAYT